MSGSFDEALDIACEPVPKSTRSTARITEPGVYDMHKDTYHNDPCPTPSLSSGMINDLMIAPKKCWHNSKRLNPKWEEPEGQEKFTIGTVSHVIFLEPHEFDASVVVCPFDDWRKNEAKDMRSAARELGKTAILAKHLDKIRDARAEFMANGFVREAFANGTTERSIFWRHKRYGFWCRERPDFMDAQLRHLCDYKATANANPALFGRHAYNMAYYRRAAWYLDGVEATCSKLPDHYWFVNQEVKAPYLTSVIELDWAALEDGRAENEHACAIFARCLETNDWYGYRHQDCLDRDRAFKVSLPPYAQMEIDRRLSRDLRNFPPSIRLTEEEEVE